jgi:hypothetical protein
MLQVPQQQPPHQPQLPLHQKLSETNAATSAATATAQAVLADADRVAAAASASTSQNAATTATTQANLATDRAGYAEEWAITAFETLVSAAAGGNQVDEYSALHWATVAEGFAGSVDSGLYGQLAQAEVVTGNWSLPAGATIDGITASNLVDKSATEIITGAWSHSSASFGNFKIKRSGTTSAAVKYENNNGIQGYIGFLDGGTFRVWDNVIGTVMSVTSAGAMTLASVAATGAVTGSNLNVSNWDTAFGWGDHAGLYLPIGGGTLTGNLNQNKSAASISNVFTVTNNTYDVDIQYVIGSTLTALMRWDSSANSFYWMDRDPSAVTQMALNLETGALQVTGAVTGSNLNVSDWDTAFGWGDHASGGYMDNNIGSSLVHDDVSGGNLDTLTAVADRGFYKWGATAPVTGSPGWTYGNMLMLRDPNQAIQIAWGSSTKGRLAVRRADSGTFYAWTEFAPLASPTFTGVPVTPRLDATSQYIEMRPTNAAGPSGIYFKNNAGAAQGYVYASGAGQFGLLHSGGGWAVQIASGSPNVSLLGTVTTTGAITEAGTSLASKYLGIAAQAADSALLGGIALKASGSVPSGQQVIQSHTNGYTYLGWINTTSGATTTDPTRIYCSSDAFIRYMTPANFIDFLQGEDWGFTTEVKFNTLSPQASVGFIGNYSDTGTSTWGGTIWAMDEAYNAAVGGANSANTGCYGIRWLRASHTSAQGPVGEGLYVYQNGNFKGGIGSVGIYSALALRVDGDFDLNGNIVGDGASTISGIETITVDSTGDITKSGHGNYLYHQSTTYDDDQEGGITFSTSAPSGGADGDIWFEYT